jgi:hypothetical protein
MKELNRLLSDERLDEADKKLVEELNASIDRLNCARAIEINVSGPFARSKIAWKLAAHQHALLHRIVALMDGASVAWNNHCTLSAFLSARAFMETFAVIAELDRRVASLLEREDLGGLDALAQHGIFATRDPELISEFPETEATNAITYINKFDKRAAGFRGHYDMLSERCHPNASGHNFMFSELDRSNGAIHFCDEREPRRNAKAVLAGLALLPLTESIMTNLNDSILKVSDLHHHIPPVGSGSITS